MMYIWTTGANHTDDERSYPWWVGDERPKSTSCVMTFQADGHELEMILEAMRVAHVNQSSQVVLCSKFHEEES